MSNSADMAEWIHQRVQQSLRENPRGSWSDEREPDYEQMHADRIESRGGSLAGAEDRYEAFLDRPWGDA